MSHDITLKHLKPSKIAGIVIFSFLTAVAVSLRLDVPSEKLMTNFFASGGLLSNLLTDIYFSLPTPNITTVLPFLLTILLSLYKESKSLTKRSHVYTGILAGLFTFFTVVGYSFYSQDNWDLVFGSVPCLFKAVIKAAGFYYLFHTVLLLLFDALDLCTSENSKISTTSEKSGDLATAKDSKSINLKAGKDSNQKSLDAEKNSNKKPYLKTALFFFLCWLPYLLIFYPGSSSSDTGSQLLQYFHQNTYVRTLSAVTGENIFITNHHSAFLTFVFGSFVKFGMLLGSDELGMFLYSIFLMCIMSVTFTTTLYYMKAISVPRLVRKTALFFYACYPLYGLWSITMLKDTIFSAFLLLYTVELLSICHTKGDILAKKSFITAFFITGLLVMLTKSQGFYMLLVIAVVLLVVYRTYYKKWLLLFGISFLLFQGAYLNVLLPALNVAPVGRQELYSVFFQQTARYVSTWGSELTPDEISAINGVLPCDELADLYKPCLSDPVKFTYNQQATGEELRSYMAVWGTHFLKHPTTYIQATMNNCYAFFYPNKRCMLSYFGVADNMSHQNGVISIRNLNVTSSLQKLISYGVTLLSVLPGIGLFFNTGNMTWMILFLLFYYGYRKRSDLLIGTLPVMLSILIFFISPTANIRYAMPLFYSFPLLVSMLFAPEKATNQE